MATKRVEQLMPAGHVAGVPTEHQIGAQLKIELLATGLRLDPSAESRLSLGSTTRSRAKGPLRTRSGVSGGLDLQLPGEIFVNAPILEPFTADSELVLVAHGEDLELARGGVNLCAVSPIPEPAYYSQRTRDQSKSLREIGQMCSPDRFCYGMTGPGCSFWRADHRCRYCSIGSDVNSDGLRKQEDHLYQALEAACLAPDWPARHVLLGGGTPSGDDMGAKLAAHFCQGIKDRFDLPVYVMIVAPLKNDSIDMLSNAAVDEVGFNLEFWSDAAWSEFIPGKHERVGKARYLQALEYAVSLFGQINTRSILIAGLEPSEDTVAGVTALADLGVMPILSPFRPLVGTQLVAARGFTPREYVDLLVRCQDVATGAGVLLGPTCLCCQNNTLALPFGEAYRRY
jgi:hypothetical protein